MEISDYRVGFVIDRRSHADSRRGALPELIRPCKFICTGEQGMVFFHKLES